MRNPEPVIHFAASSAAAERVEMGESLCRSGRATRTEYEQYVTALFDAVTCRNCRRLVHAANRRDEQLERSPS